MTSRNYLSVADVATIIGFKPKTIRSWCSQGRFPNARKFPDDKPRSEWRIPEKDVADFKAKKAVESPQRMSRKKREELLSRL
ncbi:helix-turn-helix domain-containing protein [Nesterenkonia pannonica]|uniref:helix-turn-helix domain-containing protein n=1 Tax=Nesterenkonia pannonica TaxID=1548602 RepID=UPI002164236B|nr:helix-turn-helix domain-containing protein [Nesterenkonia pannonica]